MQCLKRKSEENKDFLLLMSIIIMNLGFFFLIGENGYIEMRDTASYCLPNLTEGIMPVYPFLINSFRILFSENYLTAVSVFQGFLAVFCITVFLMFLKKKFALKYGEVYLLWTATVLPFAIELPRYVLTHVIYTEGITYSLFYVFVLFAWNTILEKKFIWYWASVIIAFLLGLTRPQLMLLFVLTSLLLFYLLFAKKKKMLFSIVLSILLAVIIMVAGVIGIFKIRTFYVRSVGAAFEEYFPTGLREEIVIVKQDTVETESVQTQETTQEHPETEESQAQTDSFSQLSSALICRTFYEAEANDYLYYTDKDMQEIFARVYRECDKREILYQHARQGLWMWEDLTQTDIYTVANQEIGNYFRENYPEMNEGEILQKVTQVKILMALKEVQLHFGRFVYHCIRLMIPGFISCIFFNIEAIYLLCHIIVLFLYASAVAMGIYILRKEELKNDVAKVLLASVISCMIFVGVVNILFFGMQRYFIYNMGVFYCTYYLALREIFKEQVEKLEVWLKRNRKIKE